MQRMPPNEISTLTNALSERDGHVEQLSSELSALRQQLQAMHESSSWKVTSPLRWVAQKTKGA
jgi:hypothetical protein